jgi:hypothetical protein
MRRIKTTATAPAHCVIIPADAGSPLRGRTIDQTFPGHVYRVRSGLSGWSDAGEVWSVSARHGVEQIAHILLNTAPGFDPLKAARGALEALVRKAGEDHREGITDLLK